MKSPFTGGEAILKTEKQHATFRGKEYEYVAMFYECSDTHERFTTTEIDEANVLQVYNQYRVENSIPFPDEIRAIREKYGISASAMSTILGFGTNQYRLYENGEMPNISNGRALSTMFSSNHIMLMYLEYSKNEFSEDEYERIKSKITSANEEKEDKKFRRFVFDYNKRDEFNGYAHQSLSKLKNVMLFYIGQLNGVFKTQMNKLLFYTDFAYYRKYGKGLTGLTYTAMQYGPVPLRWDRVYSSFDEIVPITEVSSNGHIGEKITSDMQYDESAFSLEQKEILELVLNKFGTLSPTELSRRSHEENAWIENKDLKGKKIDYSYAFSLKMI